MPKEKKPKNEKEEQKEPEIKIDLGLGGIFKGIATLLSKAEELAEKGEQIKEFRDIAGVKGSRAVIGYNIRTIRGGRPIISKFGNIKETKLGPVIEEKREPLIDIFEEKNETKIIAELPGVEEKDIKLDLEGKKLAISVDTEERKYYKEIELPAPVKNMTSSYKNGVLEIRLSKQETKPGG